MEIMQIKKELMRRGGWLGDIHRDLPNLSDIIQMQN